MITVPTENLIKIAEFDLKNNLMEFDDNVFQQISGTVIIIKFARLYACIYMDRVKQDFSETEELQSLLYLRFIDNIFFHLHSSKARIKKFMEKLNNFTPNLMSPLKKVYHFLTHNHRFRMKVKNYLTCKVYRSPSVPILCLLTSRTY